MASYRFWHRKIGYIINHFTLFLGGCSISLKILLDTNFLLIPSQFGVDIFQEIDRIISRKFELILFKGIIDELKQIAKQSAKRQKEVSIALELSNRCKLIEINSKTQFLRTVDEIILHLAVENKWIVATNDRKLRKKLRSYQIPIIFLRKKAFLSIEGDIPP